jgi:hypothetical protein
MFSMAIPVFILLNCEPLHCMNFTEDAIKNIGKKQTVKLPTKRETGAFVGGVIADQIRQISLEKLGTVAQDYYTKLECLGIDDSNPLIQKLLGMKNRFGPDEIIEGFGHQYATDKKTLEVFLSLHHEEHVSISASINKMTAQEKYNYLQEKLGKDYNTWYIQKGVGTIPVLSGLRFPLPTDSVIVDLHTKSKELSLEKSSKEKPSITLKSNKASNVKPQKKGTFQMWKIFNHSHKGNPNYDDVFNHNKETMYL